MTGLLLAGVLALPALWQARTAPPVAPEPKLALAVVPPPAVVRPSPPRDPEPPPVEQALQKGTLIVISKASQTMHVFHDGEPWDSCPVSTGRRGHATPAGVFPILQKQVFHRSNKYSNAPMPYMQRLTWSGIAIHAGHVPRHAASHGCIRVPYAFARRLYALTRASETTVVIANDSIGSHEEARELALAFKPAQRGGEMRLAVTKPALAPSAPALAPVPPAAGTQGGQTIQLAAASTPAEAEAHWARLLGARPDLARFRKVVVPAVVGGRTVYRLRAVAPDAHATCSQLKSAGIDCFRVI